jgi:hypothetical protein
MEHIELEGIIAGVTVRFRLSQKEYVYFRFAQGLITKKEAEEELWDATKPAGNFWNHRTANRMGRFVRSLLMGGHKAAQ